MNQSNSVWAFFASVKLALVTLFFLAITSIIGTVIPQKETAQVYIDTYGQNTANLFQIFSIPDMYNSWWFLGLLALLSANLIVCSIERFPAAWAIIKADNLATPLKRLQQMRLRREWTSALNVSDTEATLAATLNTNGWKNQSRQKDSGRLLFSQKAPMSRTGVYIVHISILIIFVGAIIGEMFGYKGSVMLPETQSTEQIYTFRTNEAIPLGFEVRCDLFEIELYDNGMAKAYRSELTVLENNEIVRQKTIVVNDPLTYKGVTFYQSSYQPYQSFVVTVSDMTSAKKIQAILPYQQQHVEPNSDLRFGIINAKTAGQSVTDIKLWLKDQSGVSGNYWLSDGEQKIIEHEGTTYLIAAKQMYATGLQIAKDPGVWTVYVGFTLMIIGLLMAFFMSHRRLWIHIREEDGKTLVLMSGSANKNRGAFEKTFSALADQVQK
ncbi:MAG: cytochrome c biogenesis protein ResB [Desulfobulbaceae bacterium]|uniref:Cytochrome c biogenesis protein ResB n=1 Tax=Candidatus Desulfatifera sulfidica TaxID=2841691 RepID=A0A8J6N7U1_9BACT|nr:cytochrome c biogenesis protein ResB [Candidatus Desulfatifera sulfidica]